MTRRVYLLVVAGLLVLAGVRTAGAQTYVEDGIQGAGKQHVIITVTPGHESEVIDAVRKHGGSVSSQHPSINGLAADINGSDVVDLASHGAVTITRDQQVRLTATTTSVKAKDVPVNPKCNPNPDPGIPQCQAVSTLRLSLGLTAGAQGNLSSGINGSGVVVAIIDSGISLADFDGSVTGFYDFTKSYGSAGPINDLLGAGDVLGHGTHLAGLIASTGAKSNYMFQGIAPKASIVALKVLDNTGAGSTSQVIAAIEFVVKNHLAQVINLSLGHRITAPAKFDPLVQAVENAVRHNVSVVIAAGNDGPGYGSVNSPGNSPSAITVGAADGKTTVTRTDDYVPSFSSKGPTWYDGLAKPDVVAPGVNLFSNAAAGSALVTSVTKNPDGTTSLTYPQEVVGSAKLLDLSGTSVAAAVATGVVALELDANANQLTPNAAKAILEYTAIKMAKTDVLTQGAGQINAIGATQLAGSVNTTVATGSWWLTAGVSGASVIGGATYNWAQNIIWGTSVIGGRFIYYKNLAWDDNIIWGTGVVRGKMLVSGSKHIKVRGAFFDDNIIWGTDFQLVRKNVVFGKADDNIIWGTNLTDFRVIGERVGNKIRWAIDDADNIIWGTLDDDNIIWGTDDGDNIIWGTWSGDGDNIIWGTTADDNIIWGTSSADDNIIWGTSAPLSQVAKIKNQVVGTKIIWATGDSDNIIWGTADGDNIIWGTSDDNIIWGTDGGDNIIWGTDSDNLIWGTSVGGRS
jgi:serine protease AprX